MGGYICAQLILSSYSVYRRHWLRASIGLTSILHFSETDQIGLSFHQLSTVLFHIIVTYWLAHICCIEWPIKATYNSFIACCWLWLDKKHRPLRIRTDGNQSRVRELGCSSFFAITLTNVVRSPPKVACVISHSYGTIVTSFAIFIAGFIASFYSCTPHLGMYL